MDIAKGEYGSTVSLENLLRSAHSNVSHLGRIPNIVLSAKQIRMISAYIRSVQETR
jgi:hypothetical protein